MSSRASFFISSLQILCACFALEITATLGLNLLPAPAAISPGSGAQCTPVDQANPIASQYPEQGTGTSNGTLVIIPIDYSVARSIVPQQYPILTHAYEHLMPSLGNGKYPMYLSTARDHDLRQPSLNLSVPDFTRASLVFPFIDRLRDNSTSFRYGAPILITPNPVVAAGSSVSQQTLTGSFDPACEGYGAISNASGITYLRAWTGDNQAAGQPASFDLLAAGTSASPSFGVNVYKNLTNQVLFGSGLAPLCDHFTQLFNTSVSEGAFAPQFVRAVVRVRPPYFPSSQAWVGMEGLRLDAAFIESPGQDCAQFKGYEGTGSGDSSELDGS